MQPTDRQVDAGWAPGTLLAVLTETARKDLVHRGVRRSLPTGRVVFREGDSTRHVAVLLAACVKVTAQLDDGREALLAIRVSGDMVGELAAIDQGPRSATVTTCGDAVVQVLSRAEFQDFLQEHPAAAMAVAAMVAQRLRSANRRRVDLAGLAVKVRLARILFEIAVAHGRHTPDGVELGVTLIQPELAALTGAAEVTVHKAVAELRRDGILDTGYRRIRVRDLEALRRAAHIPDNSY